MKRRVKLSGILLTCCMGAAVLVSNPLLAEEAAVDAADYERVVSSYGERAENYIYQTEAAGTPVGVVITSEGKAHTYTDTNLREGPGAETASLAVLPANAQVLIWGYTENGWTKVFYRESDLSGEGQESAQTIFEGYIKTDLLIKTGL